MKNLCVFVSLLLLAAAECSAWDTPPHMLITRTALETLPARYRAKLGGEADSLVRIYCMLPDRYAEMEHFGFTRKAPGPRTAAEIRQYCFRPDGEAVHSASFDRDEDLRSLVFLFERIVSSLNAGRTDEAAKFMGTLSHFLADSLSPPHAVSPRQLSAMLRKAGETEHPELHRLIERSAPEFGLAGRAPRRAGKGLVNAAEQILDRCYAAASENRRDLPAMAKAVNAGDEAALDRFRLRAGRTAAELLADSLYTLFLMAGE